jgi:predicted metal-dependent hydrolase
MHFQSQETGLFQSDDVEVPYRVFRSARRRRTISLSFGSEHGLRLMVPMRTSSQRIKMLLDHRASWIRKRYQQLNRHGPFRQAEEFKDGTDILYLGQKYRLQITFQKIRKAQCLLGTDSLEVTAGNEAKARKAVLDWYRAEAAALLAERIQPLANQLGVRYRSLSLTNALRLWGCCTHKNDIRINWRIVLAPLPLVDCLLAHELCHIVHKNHSRKFWTLLEEIIPDQHARKKQLRELEADLLRRGRNAA